MLSIDIRYILIAALPILFMVSGNLLLWRLIGCSICFRFYESHPKTGHLYLWPIKYFLPRVIGGIVTRDRISRRYQRITPAWRTNAVYWQYPNTILYINHKNPLRDDYCGGHQFIGQKAVPESTKKLHSLRAIICAARGNIWRIIKTINYFWLRKYARIIVLGHYLFLEAHSCPRASLSGNCSLLGTDNILGQLSVHISSPKVVHCLYTHLNVQVDLELLLPDWPYKKNHIRVQKKRHILSNTLEHFC